MALHWLDLTVIVVYFLGIMAFGMWVGKFTKDTQDFFFGGRRFSWWLVAFSCVATLVGSYSFIQYAQVGYSFGFCALIPYMNEWFVLPLFLGLWLPIIYYGGIQSVPEYFERRFDRKTRIFVLLFLLVYLEGYIGINLLTIGVGLKSVLNWESVYAGLGMSGMPDAVTLGGFLDWELIIPAAIIAIVSSSYLHSGGQNSVIMTDLLQGTLLLGVGITIFLLGIDKLGGFAAFWDALPMAHKLPFPNLNENPKLNAVGDFWNDAMIGSFAFYCINQGILMRFLSVRSVRDGRKAMLFVVLILMPIAAVSVSSAGWVGKAMVTNGLLSEGNAKNIFMSVASFVTMPGVFGLVVAAIMAALMSTLDTLIAAVSAIAVNDVFRLVKPNREDSYYLKLARQTCVVVTIIGLCLIPVFDQFESIYRALSHFTSMTMPPLVVVIIFGALFKNFSARSAFWTLLLGSISLFFSILFPEIITPVAHGIDPSGGYSYIRGLFGLVTTGSIATLFLLIDKPQTRELAGLVASTLDKAIHRFKGSEPDYNFYPMTPQLEMKSAPHGPSEVRLPSDLSKRYGLRPGDLVHVSDARWWLGGFRSVHAKVAQTPASGQAVEISPDLVDRGHLLADGKIRLQKLL